MSQLTFVLVAVLACAVTSPVAARSVLSIGRGEAIFWTGPFVENASGACTEESCFTYRLRVEERGYRLRIGIDRPEIGDVFRVTIFSPSGDQVGDITPGVDLYSAEFIRENPDPGIWRIEVAAEDVTESAFRMRAKLEAGPPPLRSNEDVLPNLQVLPPHEASFLYPITNGLQGGEPLGIDVAGHASCHPEEHLEDEAVRCLRFAFGVRNTGRGPLTLFARGAMPSDAELVQRIEHADGTSHERSAGIARYHKTHGHYHHHDAVALQLFAVTDPDEGVMEKAGDLHLKGFAHRDELLRDWFTFYPTYRKDGFGLLPGWADIYEWDRPGNYIDFGTNGDGYYLVRMWADPVAGVLESNEKDNVGYTYLKVAGADVELIESGRGTDPWDPCKIVVGFGGHPDPRPETSRPRGCPPDTV